MRIEDDGGVFDTRLGAGSIRSFGFYLPAFANEPASPVLSTISKYALNKPMITINGDARRAVTGLLAPIGREYQGDVRTLLLQARALELIALVGAAIDDALDPEMCSAAVKRSSKAKDFIDAHLSSNLDLRTLAQHCSVSERTLTQAFREQFGETIMGYVTQRRMEEGARMLDDGASIAAAAYSVGYTPNAFSTAFRKHFGLAPKYCQPASTA